MNRLLSVLRVALGLALLYVVLSRAGSWSLGKAVLASGWVLAAILLVTPMGAAVESVRLQLLLRSQGIYLPFFRGLRLVLVAVLFGFVIPGGTGGDLMKLYYLGGDYRKQQVEIATVLLVDRAMGMFSLLLLIAGLAIFNLPFLAAHALVRGLVLAAVALLLAAVAGTGLFLSPAFRATRLFTFCVTRLPWHRFWARVADALFAFRQHRVALAGAVGVSMLGNAGLLCLYLAVAAVVMPQASRWLVCQLGLLGMMANILPVTPAGLGVGEAAFEALFKLAGFAGGAQLILAWRGSMILLCIPGCVFYLAGQRKQAPIAAAAPDASRGSMP